MALFASLSISPLPSFAGSGGQGSSSTSYWYGGSLHPLVVTRDGVNYRLIGKSVVESIGEGQLARSYLLADRLGSVRVVSDDQGQATQSLGYDDYGLTRIAGESSAAADGSMASFYRFEGQEQETFALSTLGIQDDALASWLDAIQLYHFPWRDYAASFAAFTETDPVPSEDSLYAALGANPVNFTDETGGMIGNGDASRVDNLLDQVLQDFLQGSATNFDDRDLDLLRERLDLVEGELQGLQVQNRTLAQRIADANWQLQQIETELQTAHNSLRGEHAYRLISEHQTRLRRLTGEERDRHIAILLRTAEDLSHRRMSPLERQLSDQLLRLRQSQRDLQRELQTVNGELRDVTGWLDIYQIPLNRLLNPSEAEDDDDDDDDFDIDEQVFPLGSSVSPEPRSEDENAEDAASAPHDRSSSRDPQRDRSPENHGHDHQPNDDFE